MRLVLVLPSDGGASIEVQLARGPQRYASRALAGDTTSVGRAVIEALRGVGAHAPFDVVGFHALPSDWGAGLLAVLRDTTTGELRRGVASGRAPADAAAAGCAGRREPVDLEVRQAFPGSRSHLRQSTRCLAAPPR